MTDAERLDWLEAQARSGQFMTFETCEGSFELVLGEPGSAVHVRRDTLRELIDATAEMIS